MTVGKLQEELRRFGPEKQIYIRDREGGIIELHEVRTVGDQRREDAFAAMFDKLIYGERDPEAAFLW